MEENPQNVFTVSDQKLVFKLINAKLEEKLQYCRKGVVSSKNHIKGLNKQKEEYLKKQFRIKEILRNYKLNKQFTSEELFEIEQIKSYIRL